MHYYTTTGIILKKISVGETDALFTLYTQDFGKFSGLAQGVKKEGAKLKGHLESLNLSQVSFVLGRGGERLIHAEVINPWHNIREDYRKLGLAWYVACQFDQHCFPGEKDEVLWDILIKSFYDIEQLPESDKNFIKSFDVQLLEGLGYN